MFFILIGSFSLFPIGADECVDPVNDPLQHSEQPQQGKQFDHIPLIPLLSKSNILFNLNACKLLCQSNLSFRGSYSYCMVALKLLSPATNHRLIISLVN